MITNCEYVYFPAIGRRKFGIEFVERSVQNVNVINFFLVATPSTNGGLVHPLLTPEFERQSYARLAKNRRQINKIALLYMFLLPAIFVWIGQVGFALAFFFSCLSIYIVGRYEWKAIYSDLRCLKAKVTYYSACLFEYQKLVLYALFAFVFAGLIQVGLVSQLGEADNVLERFGFIFSRISDGEYFRIFAGQFLHGGVLHWASNVITLIWFAVLCGPVIGRYVLPVSIVTSTAAYMLLASAAHLFDFQYQGVIGFSGGVSGLAGVLLGASIARHPALPRMLYISLLPPILMTLVFFSFATKTSSLLHIFGLVIGAVTGVVLAIYKRRAI